MNRQQPNISPCCTVYSSTSASKRHCTKPLSMTWLRLQFNTIDMMVTIPWEKNSGHPSSGGGVWHQEFSKHTPALGPSWKTAAHSTVLFICHAVLEPDAGHLQRLSRNGHHQSHLKVPERPAMIQAVCHLQQQSVHDRGGYQTAHQHIHGCLHYQLWCFVSGEGLPCHLSPTGARGGKTHL